jgi:hypothetical protein
MHDHTRQTLTAALYGVRAIEAARDDEQALSKAIERLRDLLDAALRGPTPSRRRAPTIKRAGPDSNETSVVLWIQSAPLQRGGLADTHSAGRILRRAPERGNLVAAELAAPGLDPLELTSLIAPRPGAWPAGGIRWLHRWRTACEPLDDALIVAGCLPRSEDRRTPQPCRRCGSVCDT